MPVALTLARSELAMGLQSNRQRQRPYRCCPLASKLTWPLTGAVSAIRQVARELSSKGALQWFVGTVSLC